MKRDVGTSHVHVTLSENMFLIICPSFKQVHDADGYELIFFLIDAHSSTNRTLIAVKIKLSRIFGRGFNWCFVREIHRNKIRFIVSLRITLHIIHTRHCLRPQHLHGYWMILIWQRRRVLQLPLIANVEHNGFYEKRKHFNLNRGKNPQRSNYPTIEAMIIIINNCLFSLVNAQWFVEWITF